jgi:hypothetical protein
MAMQVNKAAVENAKKLIRAGKVVKDSDWSKAQPSASVENKYLEDHDWDEFGAWYLARDTSDDKDTKGGHNFPFGDFKKVHRKALIAAKQRAAQNDYGSIEKAADELLEMIDGDD